MSETLRTVGASIALVTQTELGRCVLAVQRTDTPNIPYPGCWEVPGGGAEPGESAEQCARREFFEETGIEVPEAALVWQSLRRTAHGTPPQNAFFVAEMEYAALPPLRLSDEAQAGCFMPVVAFCGHPRAVRGHAIRLADYEYQEEQSLYLRQPSTVQLVA
jgi:8-oxo-dGTP diphosphatase